MVDKDFEIALDKHLKREELLFRAKKKPHGSCCGWLAPHCDSLGSIADYLRDIGFRIKYIEDCDDPTGVADFHWVETTGGVIVHRNWDGGSQGFVTGRRK